MKNKLCSGDYEVCNRYKIYMQYGKEGNPPYLGPDDIEEAEKVLQCLRKKQQLGG